MKDRVSMDESNKSIAKSTQKGIQSNMINFVVWVTLPNNEKLSELFSIYGTSLELIYKLCRHFNIAETREWCCYIERDDQEDIILDTQLISIVLLGLMEPPILADSESVANHAKKLVFTEQEDNQPLTTIKFGNRFIRREIISSWNFDTLDKICLALILDEFLQLIAKQHLLFDSTSDFVHFGVIYMQILSITMRDASHLFKLFPMNLTYFNRFEVIAQIVLKKNSLPKQTDIFRSMRQLCWFISAMSQNRKIHMLWKLFTFGTGCAFQRCRDVNFYFE